MAKRIILSTCDFHTTDAAVQLHFFISLNLNIKVKVKVKVRRFQS